MLVVWPEYISLNNWSAALITDYPNDNVPILYDDKKWKDWGASVVEVGIFARKSIPSPFSIKQGSKKDSFKDWQEWAKTVYLIMNNE